MTYTLSEKALALLNGLEHSDDACNSWDFTVIRDALAQLQALEDTHTNTDMTQEHPITPPPELVREWMRLDSIDIAPLSMASRIATRAARWGADQELEACCEWVDNATAPEGHELRAARRPKPPSLKQQALEALNRQERGRDRGCLRPEAMTDADTIRRALDALPD